ncbi:MAG: hypothetical protein O3A46_03800 [Candidatus Poribacteria bacterium]|nr:hypothetical protein [Candidatus Poribacteria bacterium]
MDWMVSMFVMIAVVSEKSKGLKKGANKRELEQIAESLASIQRQLTDMDERVADLTIMLDDANRQQPMESGSSKKRRLSAD